MHLLCLNLDHPTPEGPESTLTGCRVTSPATAALDPELPFAWRELAAHSNSTQPFAAAPTNYRFGETVQLG